MEKDKMEELGILTVIEKLQRFVSVAFYRRYFLLLVIRFVKFSNNSVYILKYTYQKSQLFFFFVNYKTNK